MCSLIFFQINAIMKLLVEENGRTKSTNRCNKAVYACWKRSEGDVIDQKICQDHFFLYSKD